MKFSALISFFLVVLVIFGGVAVCGEDALTKVISVKYKDLPLKDILKDLEAKTELRFAYADQEIAANELVTLQVDSQLCAGSV